MSTIEEVALTKVPQITLSFWIIKILATTVGETGGDALSMTMDLGYAISSAIFFLLFLITIAAQITAKSFYPFLYWTVIITTTTFGTTMADFADRSLGIGYVGGSMILFTVLMIVLIMWRFFLGFISVDNITSPKVEIFYWMTILFSQTLGTAFGDFMADSSGLGYKGSAFVFAAALTLVAILYFRTKISTTLLFWIAFILTRPLGATVGDLLTKPFASGGLHLNRISSSIIILMMMIGCILLVGRRAGSHTNNFK